MTNYLWIFAVAVVIVIVMLRLSHIAKKGVDGMGFRDIRRALLRWRYVILAAGLVCAAAALAAHIIVPYGAALGLIVGAAIAAITVMLCTALRLRMRRNEQRKQTENSSYAELMDCINSRG